MTSLLTNSAAMTALTTLKTINQNLDTTSNRVSTGQRVSNASDNAAYWSIATTVRTDNASLSAVKDSLGLGSSSIDIAYNGVTSVLDQLKNMRAKLQTALQPGIDRSKVQTEIAAIQNNMRAIADSSVANGQNWLSTNSASADYSASRNIVAGFSRNTAGTVTFSNVNIDVAGIRLYDASTTGTPATSAKVVAGSAISGTLNFSGSNQASLDIALATGGTQTITLSAASLQAHVQDITKVTKDELLSAINNSIVGNTTLNGKVNATLDGSGRLQFETIGVGSTGTGATLSVAMNNATNVVNIGFGTTTAAATAAGTASTGGAQNGILDNGTTSVDSLAIWTAGSGAVNDTTMKSFIDLVESAIAKVTDVGTKLGASKTQVDGQKSFLDTLMKANDRAIGTLVDADVEEESTRLKALQTQQQLAVQTLSIANTATQNVLSLFR
ncbi:flagellin N-terminal helical domain-containing protein [Methylobacterium symbioticum]|uniref:Flagellin n=1 Tax=Methylobacterium symbioticum TaxID=2584084 RepID=A0A509EL50_9HYPH|nr:flagellin [Methylobacterium symbioticum]VUD74910.1 Flagellin [Methylobacterium symbioticum]